MANTSGPAPDDPTVDLGSSRPLSSSAPAGEASKLPATIGAYPILRELGRGGMGVVYLARDPRLEREVALKMLPPELDRDARALDSFLGEARTLAALNHPNIATIFSLEDDGGRHFLTMERIEGRSLWERLRRNPPLTDEALSMIRQVSRALEAAHSRGVVHRDLKPSNVMVQEDGVVKVLDFGLAVRLEPGSVAPEQALPGFGAPAGTPGYMSPEQVRCEAVDPRMDVWAVGCLLYECLTGKQLITGDSAIGQLLATISFDVDTVLDAGPPGSSLPGRMRLALRRSLASRASDRFGSVRDIRLLIEEEIAERAIPRAEVDRPLAQGAGQVPGNLPRRLNSFVGRGRELEEAGRLLGEHRLVTITGAGGCGKTRLSLELAGRSSGYFPAGIWRVELASLVDPSLVPASAAAALGMQQAPGTSAVDAVVRFLGGTRVLIVLDNCEHLLDACASLAQQLLETCPGVRILATSREALRAPGEAVHVLAPLGLPAPGRAAARAGSSREATQTSPVLSPPSSHSAASEPASAGQIDGSEAVQLFVDRARSAQPDFRITDSNRGAILEVCRRLDGIPLALELAAARVKTLPVEKIRDLLDDRFRLLTRGARTAQAHQATLRALIDWSYDRLDAREQAVFRRLSAFRGAWTLDGVEAVAAGGEVEPWGALDVFTRLVEKSLIVRHPDQPGAVSARYSMLETVRSYAREKLTELAEEEQAALARHRDYIVALAMEGEPALNGPEQAAWSVRLGDALDDVRAVLDLLAAEPGGAAAAQNLASSFWMTWMNRGMWEEARNAIERTLAHPGADHGSAPYGRALNTAGNLAFRSGELDPARELYQQALSVFERAGTEVQLSRVQLNLGNIAFSKGETDEAERRYELSLEHARRDGSSTLIAGVLNNLSVIALAHEDLDRLEDLQSESLRIFEEAGMLDHVCLSLFQLGNAAFVRGDIELARERHARALMIAREREHGWNILAALSNLGALELNCGRLKEAAGHADECISRLKETLDPVIALPIIEVVAGIAAGSRPSDAARILSAAAALRAKLMMATLSYEKHILDCLDRRLREALGESEYAHAREAGEKLSLEAALLAAEGLLEGR